MGTPFQRCQNVFKDALETCLYVFHGVFFSNRFKTRFFRASSPVVSWMCGTMDNAKYVCHGIKFLDHICEFLSSIQEGIINKLTEGIKEYIDSITKIFKVSVAVDHTYSFETHASKRYKTIWSDVLKDLDEKVNNVFGLFRISITIGLVFFLWMLFKYKVLDLILFGDNTSFLL